MATEKGIFLKLWLCCLSHKYCVLYEI
jgi:hypothetical protein